MSELVGDIKRDSSVWIKKQDSQFDKFYWQDGYGAFSVDQSQIDAVKKYITNQKIKHKKTGYKTEFRGFLRKYEMEYDERYVWD